MSAFELFEEHRQATLTAGRSLQAKAARSGEAALERAVAEWLDLFSKQVVSMALLESVKMISASVAPGSSLHDDVADFLTAYSKAMEALASLASKASAQVPS